MFTYRTVEIMYLIKAKSNDEVCTVAKELDDIEKFDYLDLGEINTLELTELNPDSTVWNIGKPLVYNEETGVVLLSFSKESLCWFGQNSELLATYGVSKEKVAEFCISCSDNLYCLDTF